MRGESGGQPFDTVKLATHYEIDGKRSQDFPNFWHVPLKPVYEELPGWKEIKPSKSEDDLPKEAKDFIKRIEEYTGVSVSIISTGQERDAMIIRNEELF